MVIEVISWPSAKKTHAINQDNPTWTCCGIFVAGSGYTRGHGDDAFPTCLRCRITVMNS